MAPTSSFALYFFIYLTCDVKWIEISPQHCRDKVAHAMRDGANLIIGKTTKQKRQSMTSNSNESVDQPLLQIVRSSSGQAELQSNPRLNTSSSLFVPTTNPYQLGASERLPASFSISANYPYATRFDQNTANANLPTNSIFSMVDNDASQFLPGRGDQPNRFNASTAVNNNNQQVEQFNTYGQQKTMKSDSKCEVAGLEQALLNSSPSNESFICSNKDDESDDYSSSDSFVQTIDDTLGPMNPDGTDPF
jgi:hypothetical protein